MSCYMRRKELLARDGITNSTLYRWVEQKRFPAPVKLVEGGRASGWLREEVEALERCNIARQRADRIE